MSVFHIDYESRSKADLTEVGAYRYAADPSTRLLMMAISKDDQEPRILYPSWILAPDFHFDLFPEEKPDQIAVAWWDELVNSDSEVYAHYAGFEIAMTQHRLLEDFKYLFGAIPKLSQWRCTAALGRRAALPGSLEKLGDALKLEQQKDKAGKLLIKKFSMPKEDGTFNEPWDFVPEFDAFSKYCLQDVRTEQAIEKRLRPFALKGESLNTWKVDCIINSLGVPVNVDGLQKAKVVLDEAQSDLIEDFRTHTKLNPTQNAKVLAWFQARGYPGDNMQAMTVADALKDTSWAKDQADKVLEIKADLSFASVNKIKTMLNCQWHGVVRGTLLYYGAGPGRWTGHLIQPQNFKRPTIKDTQEAYADICAGFDRDGIELLYGPAIEVLSSSIRHFIHPPKGAYDADYSAIEARGVCWLADQQDALQRFFNDEDSYIDMAGVIFNRDRKDVTKDQRWLGKQTVLGCGYQMGPPRFYDQAITNAKKFNIKGLDVTMELAERAVAAYREQYSKVKQLWYDVDKAARNAILHPGQRYTVQKLSFVVSTVAGIPFLIMKLPSGRSIVYPYPMLEDNDDGRTAITYWAQLPKKQAWGRVKIYGGLLVENACQGFAADIMANGAWNAINDGFEVFMLVHDQALAHKNGMGIQRFCDALTNIPAWAKGFPAKVDGKEVPFYLKL